MKRIETPLPISDQVADSIRKSIMSGELGVGQKISVSSISEKLEVSATPVKQAFKILQSEGLLITKPRSGTMISDLAYQSLSDISILRSALEGAAVYLAAKNATDEDIQMMEQILDEGEEAIKNGDVVTLVKQNAQFHRKLRMSARNTYLYVLIERLMSFDYTIRSKALITDVEREKGRVEHREILNLVKQRKPEAAEAALVEHIRSTAKGVVPKK
ncbi:GntR family transcriptional regulator [Sphaerochaeta sp. PS]|uniref:GntR family transcriptional regulator n=1 Tax=Sphaerochaeta sp. PS TaxID=3076336 RepID=UPI0028A3E9EB|nr:GntR family transcriptional regulator [Sphaerochaeta sp. PS]MDT4762716.1 GntR family transcriptional regulator [Sphaerochaeta sp. PS]